MRGACGKGGIGDKGDLYKNRTNVLDLWSGLRYNVYAVESDFDKNRAEIMIVSGDRMACGSEKYKRKEIL